MYTIALPKYMVACTTSMTHVVVTTSGAYRHQHGVALGTSWTTSNTRSEGCNNKDCPTAGFRRRPWLLRAPSCRAHRLGQTSSHQRALAPAGARRGLCRRRRRSGSLEQRSADHRSGGCSIGLLAARRMPPRRCLPLRSASAWQSNALGLSMHGCMAPPKADPGHSEAGCHPPQPNEPSISRGPALRDYTPCPSQSNVGQISQHPPASLP